MATQNITPIATAPSRAQRLAEAKARYEAAKREVYAAQRRAAQAQSEYEQIVDEFAGPLVD